MDLLIDTNILIDHLRGHAPASTYLAQARRQGQLWVSVITIAEIHAGQKMRLPAEQAKVSKLLQHFRSAYLDGNTAAQGGALARDCRVDLPDALIAAIALNRRLPLITRNIKHFAAIPGLQVLVPY